MVNPFSVHSQVLKALDRPYELIASTMAELEAHSGHARSGERAMVEEDGFIYIFTEGEWVRHLTTEERLAFLEERIPALESRVIQLEAQLATPSPAYSLFGQDAPTVAGIACIRVTHLSELDNNNQVESLLLSNPHAIHAYVEDEKAFFLLKEYDWKTGTCVWARREEEKDGSEV